jgi:hypothetical protein
MYTTLQYKAMKKVSTTAPAPEPEGENESTSFTFRLRTDWLAEWKAEAARRRLPLSTFIRQAVFAEIERGQVPKTGKEKKNG